MEARKDSMGPWRVGWESIKANWLPMVVLWLLAAACVLACPVAPLAGRGLQMLFGKLEMHVGREGIAYGAERICKTLAVLVLMAICTVMMAGNTYSAFLYFRF